jgi:hypothetical protein
MEVPVASRKLTRRDDEALRLRYGKPPVTPHRGVPIPYRVRTPSGNAAITR